MRVEALIRRTPVTISSGATIRQAAEAHGIPLPELLKALGINEK